MTDNKAENIKQPDKALESTLETAHPEETLNSSKESECENLEAIKKFIQDQDKEVPIINTEPPAIEKSGVETIENSEKQQEEITTEVEKEEDAANIQNKKQDETMDVASSVMDMILSESEAEIAKKRDGKTDKQNLSSGDKGTCMALSVGSKVKAKDFEDLWHSAQIVEVDYDEMEVLVHYENTTKRHDEWISVSSPRLRPIDSPSTDSPTPTATEPSGEGPLKEESKHEEKAKLTFAVGERCLARWRDNRRFIATISEDLGDGKYEIIFDDGVRWSCNTTRLYKLKGSKVSLSVDASNQSVGVSTPSPVYPSGPSSEASSAGLPVYHTHLFDPARDYLSSKSERREMKRKLNIKEIFNIGQKKRKVETLKAHKETPKVKVKNVQERKPKVVKKKLKVKVESDAEVQTEAKEIPDAVASIIGTVDKSKPVKDEVKEEIKEETEIIQVNMDSTLDADDVSENSFCETLRVPEKEIKAVLEDEVKLENFEQPNAAEREEVIDRMKEVITKLEDGLTQVELKKEIGSPKLELNEAVVVVTDIIKGEKSKKSTSKVKKSKKLRLLQEKKVKKQVEKVKCELEEMKKQVEEMRKQMLMKTEEMEKGKRPEMPESFLLPGEWCCRWVNGQPVGTVSEIESEQKPDPNKKPALPRRSVQVEDKRLPEGWTKHMIRRSFGNSAGKWDVVLVGPDNRRFHTKTDMRNYLEANPNEALKPFEPALLDFGVHLKLSRRMGWYITTPDGAQQNPMLRLPAGTLCSTSPLIKRKKLSLNKQKLKKKKKISLKLKVPRPNQYTAGLITGEEPGLSGQFAELNAAMAAAVDPPLENVALEDGCIYVGSLKVQIIENLLRCPAEGCFKNFRKITLLKMHIKHYHRELKKMLGATPKVLDLAYARARPTEMEMRRLKLEAAKNTIKVKLPKLPRRVIEQKTESKELAPEVKVETSLPEIAEVQKIPRSQDSPKLRQVMNKIHKRPKVLLPVRRPEAETVPEVVEETATFDTQNNLEQLDFETAISTHTVTKPLDPKRKEKKRKFAAAKKSVSEEDEWFATNNSDVETRSSYPRSGTPDSKSMDQKFVSSESNEEQKEQNMYTYTETGERIKIVHMKREEIINCHCGFREEDGLMVQCELCLCWQHALCHNIQRESEVPEKYTCSICLNPRRGRRSQRFLHDQDRLYEGLLPGAKPCESLRRSHELSGNLLRIQDALHALRVKYYVATKKDHPKLYLWAKDWEMGELAMTQEKLNSDYSDLNIMISTIGKENLPAKGKEPLEICTPPSEHGDKFKDTQLGSQALLNGLLSSPGGGSLDLPISTSELERLAKTVQAEQEAPRPAAPQPEAAIENSACRERLLRHIQRCQALIDARLDSIEAQVAELESQDPSFEDDETADYFPRTKQTIQMLMRDLDTMEELGVIT